MLDIGDISHKLSSKFRRSLTRHTKVKVKLQENDVRYTKFSEPKMKEAHSACEWANTQRTTEEDHM